MNLWLYMHLLAMFLVSILSNSRISPTHLCDLLRVNLVEHIDLKFLKNCSFHSFIVSNISLVPFYYYCIGTSYQRLAIGRIGLEAGTPRDVTYACMLPAYFIFNHQCHPSLLGTVSSYSRRDMIVEISNSICYFFATAPYLPLLSYEPPNHTSTVRRDAWISGAERLGLSERFLSSNLLPLSLLCYMFP